MNFKKINFITQQFFINSRVLSVDFIASGLINKTYIVEHLHEGIKSKFILQCLSEMFESHNIVNTNHKLITDHMNRKISQDFINIDCRRWEVPNLIKCKSNNLFFFPFDSGFWRAFLYIDQTFNLDFLEDKNMAFQTGIGLSKFHLFCSDLDSSKLETSISNFHNTSYYIEQYIKSLEIFDSQKLDFKVNQRINNLTKNLSRHIKYVEFLFFSLRRNIRDYNIIHGDPKLNNFLFDIKHKNVVSLIDLDTVSSGFLQTDLADCIRSICNLFGEDPENKDNVWFDINTCILFLKGYSSITNEKGINSFRFLLESIYLIIFELTVRFFTDFLQSNKYFKIRYETHNLFKAEVQFLLLSSFLTQLPILSNELYEIGISTDSTFISDVQDFV